MRRIFVPLALALACAFAFHPSARAVEHGETVRRERAAGGEHTEPRPERRRAGDEHLEPTLGKRRGKRGAGKLEVVGDGEHTGKVRYGKGKDGGRSSKRYRNLEEAEEQYNSISEAQQRNRGGIESIEKSRQGFEFSLRGLLGKRSQVEDEDDGDDGQVRANARGSKRRGRAYLEH